MNTCDDIRAQLPLFVGGDLEAPLEDRVRQHLGLSGGDADGMQGVSDTGCGACGRVLADLRAARRAVLELPERSPAPEIDLWPALREVLAAEGRLQRPAAATLLAEPVPAGRLLTFRRRAAAAAAVLIAGAGLVAGLRSYESAGVPAADVDGSELVFETRDLPAGPTGDSVAEALAVPASTGGLRRLQPGEALMSSEALPFIDGMELLAPGEHVHRRPMGLRPVAPTLASDRWPR